MAVGAFIKPRIDSVAQISVAGSSLESSPLDSRVKTMVIRPPKRRRYTKRSTTAAMGQKTVVDTSDGANRADASG
jgi:hypothetical protein